MAIPGAATGPKRFNPREITNRLLSDGGSTPLDIMIKNMRWFDQQASLTLAKVPLIKVEGSNPTKAKKQKQIYELIKAVVGLRNSAQLCARDAAPYMHPRLVTMDVGNKDDKPFVLRIDGVDANL